MTVRSRVPALCLGIMMVVTFGGCQAGDPTAASDPSAQPTQAAPWALDVATGTQMWQTSSEGLTLTAYDMGEDTARWDSGFSDDVTDEPLFTAGDSIVFVNLVLTNTSDKVVYTNLDMPELLAAPAASPYARQGLANVVRASESQWRDHDVWYHTARLDADTRMGDDEPSPWSLAPGESCARGYALPLGLGPQWGFIGSAWIYDNVDDPGRAVAFEPQTYTFG